MRALLLWPLTIPETEDGTPEQIDWEQVALVFGMPILGTSLLLLGLAPTVSSCTC